jgi:hypothetical protein
MAEVEVLKRELDVTTSTAINVLDHNPLAPNATLQTWSRLADHALSRPRHP